MKKYLISMFLLLAELGFGQTNYYSFNTDALFSEKQVQSAYEKAVKMAHGNYDVKPTIYHRIIRKDSIINFIEIVFSKSNGVGIKNKFELPFKQDSLFLLLGKKLPPFNLKDVNGNEYSSAQIIGKPTLINFWATYCGPCVAEFPQLDELKEKYGKRMNFIAITENTSLNDHLKEFLEKHPFNFYMLQNGEYYKKALKISAIPRNIFIDKDGFIRYIQGNYPYEMDSITGNKIYPKNNYFVKVIDELLK